MVRRSPYYSLNKEIRNILGWWLKHQTILITLNYNFSVICFICSCTKSWNQSNQNRGWSGGSIQGWLSASSVVAVGVMAVAERSEGEDEKRWDLRAVGLNRNGSKKVRKSRLKECVGTVCLNHSTAGTVCAARVQFQQIDVLHVPPPFVWFSCWAVMEVLRCCLQAAAAFC